MVNSLTIAAMIIVMSLFFLLGVPAALYQTEILPNIFIVETIIILFAILAVVYIVCSGRCGKIIRRERSSCV